MHKGDLVEFTDPKTHQTVQAVYERTARFGTGFVASFCTTLAGRKVTVAVTKLRPARESSAESGLRDARLPVQTVLPMIQEPQPFQIPQNQAQEHQYKPEPAGEPIPPGFHRHRVWGTLVPDADTEQGDRECEERMEAPFEDEDESELPSRQGIASGEVDRLLAKYSAPQAQG